MFLYSGASVAAAYFLPPLFGFPARLTHDIALAAFVSCIAMHVLVAVGVRQRRIEQTLNITREAQVEIRKELTGARGEAKAIHEALVNAAQAREGDRTTIGEVIAEVRMLQDLVADLSRRTEVDETAAAGGPIEETASDPMPPIRDFAPARDAPGSPRRVTGLDETAVLDIVREGLREGRVDLYVQPIVSLPQRKHRHYECFSRIRTADGALVGPDQYLSGAEREGLIGTIDNMLLFRSVQLVRRVQKANRNLGIFVNISESSLADQKFFREFVSFVADNSELAPGLIFEFAQSHVARHGSAVMLELERLARLGFRFSMDQVVDLDIDVDALAQRHFRFIKIEARRLLQAAQHDETPVDLRRFKAALQRGQIDLIVEKIESEQQLVELLDYPLDYGQGYLFGEPKVAKAA
jgi:cyclic-di-GMP phosphodiesterase TipF (flagellum assembly factor)